MIAETGIRLSLKSAWVRRIIFFCWLPILYWGVGLFAFEQVTQTNRGSVLDFEQTDQMAPPSEIEMEVPEGESNPSIPRPSIPGPGQPDLPEPMQEIQDAVEAEGRDMIRKESLRELRQVVSAFPGSDKLMDIIESGNKEQIRHTFWTWLLMTYFRYPQSVALIFLVGFITPSLIARDIRSRALMIYFSRPIGRFEYIFGKLAIPSAFLAFITTLPALALYLLGIFLSPDPSIIFWTWDIPLRILLASGVVIIPTV
jgi:hypothetical protein